MCERIRKRGFLANDAPQANHLDAGTDVITVASIVGHFSVDTTRRYDRRGERAKERAADTLPLTYERRR